MDNPDKSANLYMLYWMYTLVNMRITDKNNNHFNKTQLYAQQQYNDNTNSSSLNDPVFLPPDELSCTEILLE